MIGRNGFEQAEKRAAKQSAHGYPRALLGNAGMRSKLKAGAVPALLWREFRRLLERLRQMVDGVDRRLEAAVGAGAEPAGQGGGGL